MDMKGNPEAAQAESQPPFSFKGGRAAAPPGSVERTIVGATGGLGRSVGAGPKIRSTVGLVALKARRGDREG
jgi:hypothetical protein